MLHEILDFDPSWLSVYLELVRRARTDPAFRTRLEDRETEFVLANRARVEEAQRAGEIRDDLDPKSLGIFVNLVLHGLIVQRATGEDPPPRRARARASRRRYRRSSPAYALAYTRLTRSTSST